MIGEEKWCGVEDLKCNELIREYRRVRLPIKKYRSRVMAAPHLEASNLEPNYGQRLRTSASTLALCSFILSLSLCRIAAIAIGRVVPLGASNETRKFHPSGNSLRAIRCLSKERAAFLLGKFHPGTDQVHLFWSRVVGPGNMRTDRRDALAWCRLLGH